MRLHTQFDLERGVPIRIDVTEGINRGEADERAVLRQGPGKRPLLRDGPRLREVHACSTTSSPPKAATSAACATTASTRSSKSARCRRTTSRRASCSMPSCCLGETTKSADDRPDHPLRLVVVKTTPHEKRGGAAGPASNGLLLIATNLLDLPAWIIALDLPLPLDDRNLLPLLQARAGLPALC